MRNEIITIPLTSDAAMPSVGFGTYLIKQEDASSLVQEAIRAGYRHVDTAEVYFNEEGVGQGIRAGMDEMGLSRDDLFLTTKLWPGFEARGQEPKTYELTLEALDSSLAKLGLDYVDLYLVHAPVSPKHRLDQWRALVELRRKGKTRAIGVSNYNQAHIEEIQAAELPLPDANQIELHPWSQKPDLTAYLADSGISIIAYSSLVPLSSWRAAPGHHSGKTEEMKAEGEAEDSPFKALANKYGVTEAQVLLRWALQKGFAILPKSERVERLRTNFDLFSFEIDDGDMAAINAMDRGAGLAWGSADPMKLE